MTEYNSADVWTRLRNLHRRGTLFPISEQTSVEIASVHAGLQLVPDTRLTGVKARRRRAAIGFDALAACAELGTDVQHKAHDHQRQKRDGFRQSPFSGARIWPAVHRPIKRYAACGIPLNMPGRGLCRVSQTSNSSSGKPISSSRFP